MPEAARHKWQFRARFRRNAFGWKSQPAIKRIKEAVSEIKKAARRDGNLAAEGAVLFLERLSPALTNIDGSSGSIGNAVNRAIDALVPLIAAAAADPEARDGWLERLWQAQQADEVPYLEQLGDHWGALCASEEVASRWADRLLPPLKQAWTPDPDGLEGHRYFSGTSHCLGSLLAAERYTELLELLETAPFRWWHYHLWGARALAAQGKHVEAIEYAEAVRRPLDDPLPVVQACEEMLLARGLTDEAYERYGLLANQKGTYLAWFRAVVRKYPDKEPAEILEDLVARTPGAEGKWFAAAKSMQFFDEAVALAMRSPGSPQTLTRAARDFEEKNPSFALEAGMAALHWLVQGYGYDITSADVHAAHDHTMQAARNAGCAEETRERIRTRVSEETQSDRFVRRILGVQLGLS